VVFRDDSHRWIRVQRLGFLCEIGLRREEIGLSELLGATLTVGLKMDG